VIAGSVIALPYLHNYIMPSVYRECDVAIFPSRAEGGTNLVAMETAAMGIPTFVSDNTGHQDLVKEAGFLSLGAQTPLQTKGAGQDDWRESSVEEIIATWEKLYQARDIYKTPAADIAKKMQAWDWQIQNDRLFHSIEGSSGRSV
jgi:glycosyltransferase involved in cell wall biosynthesis